MKKKGRKRNQRQSRRKNEHKTVNEKVLKLKQNDDVNRIKRRNGKEKARRKTKTADVE